MNAVFALLLMFSLFSLFSLCLCDTSSKSLKQEVESKITLHEAVKRNDKVLVESLIKSGADINQKNSKNTSPLHIAAFYGYLDLVKLLVKQGANINPKDAEGRTPLDDALYKAHIEVVAYLLSKNAEYTNTTKRVRLNYALPDSILSMLIRLLNINEGFKSNARNLDKNKSNILHEAARNNYSEVVNLVAARVTAEELQDLLASSLKESKYKEIFTTPLSLALTNSSPDYNFIKLLLEYGAAVTQEHKKLVENRNLPEILKLLEDALAELNKIFIFTDPKEHEKALSSCSYERAGGMRAGSYEDPYENYGHTPLTFAAACGNLAKVKRLVKAGAELDKKNYWGKTALVEAANKNRLEVIKYLESQGASINLDELGQALYNAANYNNKELLEFLLAKGVSPHRLCTRYSSCIYSVRHGPATSHALGEPALFGAAKRYNYEIIDLLLEAGADVNARNKQGLTVLESLVEVSNMQNMRFNTGFDGLVECFAYLIERGAIGDFDLLMKQAQDWDQSELVEFLESKKDALTRKIIPAQENIAELPELFKALKSKNSEKVAEILKRSPESVNERDKQNNTALIVAIKTEDPKLVALILNLVADGNASNNLEQTALSIALELANTHIVKELLASSKVNVNAPCESYTVLEKVITSNKLSEEDKLERLIVLLHAGADPNALLGAGETVLALAVEENSIPLTKLLLERGAFTNIENGYGHIPLIRAALSNNNLEITRLLLEHGADPNCCTYDTYLLWELLDPMIEYGSDNTALIKLLSKYGVNIHQEKWGVTPLQYASEKGALKVVELLLECGAQFGEIIGISWDGSDEMLKNYPLCQAIKENHSTIAKLLLEKGADWSEKDDTGKTAREYALESDDQDIKELLEIKRAAQ